MTPDTLTTAEQAFRDALAASEVALRDPSFRFSVRWAHDHPDLREDFEITPVMLDAFYAFLVEEEGAELSRELYDEAAGWIDARLPEMLPPLVEPGTPLGELSADGAALLGLEPGLPIATGGGDNMMSAIGSGATRPGVVVVDRKSTRLNSSHKRNS